MVCLQSPFPMVRTIQRARILLAASLVMGAASVHAQRLALSSPSGKVQMTVSNDARLTYTVTMNGAPIIVSSPMGFQFKGEPDMGGDLTLIDEKREEVNERWAPVVRVKHAQVLNHYKGLQLHFVEKSGSRRRMDVEIRAYDDGVAFRYQLFRAEKVGNRSILRELTGFNVAGDPKAWVADYHGYATPQEGEYLPKALSAVPDSVKAGLPFLLEIGKHAYAAITEAKIDNYPGFYIGVQPANGGVTPLITKLSPLPSEPETGVKARFADKLYTPWRVVMLAESPGKLIESEIVSNLNDPVALKDVSWIKPGMSAWDHWWSGEAKMDMPTIKKYIDFAAVQGWPYMLIDWQWYGEPNKPEADITKVAPQLDMPALIAYAKKKNVRLWLWLYDSDVNRNNILEKAFPLYERWGIAGVKIDFMDRDDQDMVNWYRDIGKRAAAHHLLVDFHGAYKPDGIIRTYPNMITREGVQGEEYYKFSDREVPEHNVTIPFTRMLAGPMDYTPGGFLNVTTAQIDRKVLPTKVNDTRVAELAKFVVYESPFMVDCENPDFVLGQPGADFLKLVPSVWDDLHVLSGYPGEHVALARRTGGKFFVGAMNNSHARSIEIKLDFLPKGRYTMTTWSDADDADTNPTHLVKRTRTVSAGDVVPVKMAGSGGFVAELKKAP